MLRKLVTVVQVATAGAFVVFIVMLFRTPAAVTLPDMPPSSAPDGQQSVPVEMAAAIYSGRCASCHGAAGEGVYAPSLAGSASTGRYPDPGEQVRIVLEGKGRMRAYGGEINPEQAEAVIAYVRSLPDP